MSEYYSINKPHVLIGSKSGTTRTSIEMESSYQAESATEATKSFACGSYTKVNFDILYTMGATETTNSIEVKLETSPDGTNWYRLPTDSTTGGTSTLAAREFTFVGTNAAAATIGIFLDIAYKFMRISVKETGVATNKGSVYVEATLSGK